MLARKPKVLVGIALANKMAWRAWAVSGALLALLAIAQIASAQSYPDVIIGLGSRSLAGGSLRIAKELGLFEKRGLNASFVFTDSGTVAVAGLVSRSYKFAVTGFPDLLTAKAQGQDVVAVASTYSGLGINVVLDKAVAAKTGLTRSAPVEQRLKAMEGLLIAATGASSTTRISLDNAAKAERTNIRFTYMTYQAMLSALESGAIQGFVAAAPFWAQSVAGGKGIEWISIRDELKPQFVPTMSAVLGTTAAVVAAEPDLVQRMTDVVADIGVAVKERPADVKAAIAKLYEGLDAQTLDVLARSEPSSWATKPLTEEQVIQEIAYLKTYLKAPRGIEAIVPKTMIYGR
jgi:ABC-type nitrate/sulfonate/bicarbonate transport system substrate-binding protein